MRTPAYFILILFSCNATGRPTASKDELPDKKADLFIQNIASNPAPRTVHVLVALCDNKYQGIVPVGKSIGNGQDPANNLYWGCTYGIKTWFSRKNSEWRLLKSVKNLSDTIHERLLFRHKAEDVYLLADAYDGQYIRKTTEDFLDRSAGREKDVFIYEDDTLNFGGASQLVAYIGHNGLMDFSIPLTAAAADTGKREIIILACYSKNYFAPHIKAVHAIPLLWTTHLMAPEAYTLHDGLSAWVKQKSAEEVRTAAAVAYDKFQHCGLKGARNLLVSGW